MTPYHGPIRYTPSGVKMILQPNDPSVDSSAYVFSLPGVLPCLECTGGIINGLIPHKNVLNPTQVSNPYPNSTTSGTRIDYILPNGVNKGEIVFYDAQGKEIKRFKVDRTFDSLLISTTDIPAGTYYYQLQTSAQISEGKKMVVIK